MLDQFGRTIDYLRISITDRCNLRCRYCMPEDVEKRPMSEILTYEQIKEICEAAAELGIVNFRVTGGEPLVRRGCTELVKMLREIPCCGSVMMTTNGILLGKYAHSLKEAGLSAVNVSLDTLRRERFQEISGSAAGSPEQILRNIDAALEAGLQVKINSVLQQGINEDEWSSLAELAAERPLDVRFIEMMPIGFGASIKGVSNETLLRSMQARWPDLQPDNCTHGFGPAQYYRIPGFAGSIGLISAIHGPFCHRCNRLRLTSTGLVKACLCYETGTDLREIFAETDQSSRRKRLREALCETVRIKPEKHCFGDPDSITEHRKMVEIGG